MFIDQTRGVIVPDPLLEGHQDSEDRKGLLSWWSGLNGNVRGSLLFVVASILFALMIAMFKLAGQRLHVTEVLFFRQLTMTAIALPVIIAGWPHSVRSARPGLQFLRVGVAFTSMLLGFGAFVELPLAEVTVITFSKSFFVTLLAIVFLKEVVAIPRWSALIVGFIGVLIIVWPQGDAGATFWHFAALGSAFCVAIVIIVIRILAQVDQPVTILTYQAVGVGILILPPTIWFWQTPSFDELMLLIGIGCVSAGAQYVNILAIRSAEASALAPLEYTRLVYAAILGLWFFDEWPDDRVWIGAVIIVAAALYVVHREQRANRVGRAAGQRAP